MPPRERIPAGPGTEDCRLRTAVRSTGTAQELDQQRVEELFQALTELFNRLPDEKPVHLKTPAGKLWVHCSLAA